MEYLDFSSVITTIRNYISDAHSMNQIDMMYQLFVSFLSSDESLDFDFDNGLVCRWFITGRDGAISSLWHVSPKYMLLGGALGAFITYTVIYSINAIGPARSAMFIVSVQIVMSYLIELFGLFGIDKQPFEWRKCIGGYSYYRTRSRIRWNFCFKYFLTIFLNL